MTTIMLPPQPSAVPPLEAEPGGVRTYSADLLAASTQVDELGGFVAGPARPAPTDWSGVAANAYDDAIRPTGRQADAMSLALRSVARRVDQHADALQTLLERRRELESARADLVAAIADLRARIAAASADPSGATVARLQAEAQDLTRRVEAYQADLDRWVTDLAAEEEAMCAAFAKVLTLDQVEQQYGGVADPADGALATMPPAGSPPTDVRAWWDGLTREQQQAIIAASPGSIGNRDGIPAVARDDANRVSLDRDLAEWKHLDDLHVITDDERQWLKNAQAADGAISTIEGSVDPLTHEPLPAQLYLYDPTAFDGDGAVAVSAGNLDTAHDVATMVPGFGTDGESAPFYAERARDLYEATRTAGSESTATMFWIGYDAPDNLPWTGEGWDAAGVAGEGMATAGGDRFADMIDGLRASHQGDPAHLTAIGHSYGSTTLGHAAHDHHIPVDDLVFVGSPGVGGDTHDVGDTGVAADHVWAGANSRDPIADLSNHGWVNLGTFGGLGLGDDPAEDDFGATRFEAESVDRPGHLSFDEHSKYFDHGSESLYNLSQIASGHYDQVLTAGHVTDPWWTSPQDPEWDRTPTTRPTMP